VLDNRFRGTVTGKRIEKRKGFPQTKGEKRSSAGKREEREKRMRETREASFTRIASRGPQFTGFPASIASVRVEVLLPLLQNNKRVSLFFPDTRSGTMSTETRPAAGFFLLHPHFL
jgi:hypothetical protein